MEPDGEKVDVGGKSTKDELEELFSLLQDDNVVIRERTVKMLGETGDPRVVRHLLEVVRYDREWRVQKAAAEALELFGTEKALEPLIEALKDRDKMVRQAAVEALSHETRAVSPLIALLSDKDRSVRLQVISLLKDIGDGAAVGPLIETLKDPDINVQKSVISALGALRAPSSIEPLVNMLRDQDEQVREEVVHALGNFRSTKTIEPLIGILGGDETNERARTAAKEILKKFGDKAIKPLLGEIMESSDGLKRDNIKEILAHLFNQFLRFEEELGKARKTVRKKKLVTRKVSIPGTGDQSGKTGGGEDEAKEGEAQGGGDKTEKEDVNGGGKDGKKGGGKDGGKGGGKDGIEMDVEGLWKSRGLPIKGASDSIAEKGASGLRSPVGPGHEKSPADTVEMSGDDRFSKMEKLIGWREKGLIGPDDFNKLKDDLLNKKE